MPFSKIYCEFSRLVPRFFNNFLMILWRFFRISLVIYHDLLAVFHDFLPICSGFVGNWSRFFCDFLHEGRRLWYRKVVVVERPDEQSWKIGNGSSLTIGNEPPLILIKRTRVQYFSQTLIRFITHQCTTTILLSQFTISSI